MRRLLALVSVLLLSACGGGGRLGGEATSLECAPYARAATGIALYGDAADWWDEAEGRYARSPAPVAGGVLVFQRSARLPAGHVAVVRGQVSAREVLVDQANWVHRRITRGDAVVDVSEANDWSAVRVWWDPVAAMGASTYPTYGFLAP